MHWLQSCYFCGKFLSTINLSIQFGNVELWDCFIIFTLPPGDHAPFWGFLGMRRSTTAVVYWGQKQLQFKKNFQKWTTSSPQTFFWTNQTNIFKKKLHGLTKKKKKKKKTDITLHCHTYSTPFLSHGHIRNRLVSKSILCGIGNLYLEYLLSTFILSPFPILLQKEKKVTLSLLSIKYIFFLVTLNFWHKDAFVMHEFWVIFSNNNVPPS